MALVVEHRPLGTASGEEAAILVWATMRTFPQMALPALGAGFVTAAAAYRLGAQARGRVLAIGLGALVLFAAYTSDLQFFMADPASFPYFEDVELDFSLANPFVVVGLLLGGLLPSLFGALSRTAVGRAAGSVVIEVRRQFKEIPGIMEGTAKPDYSRCVDLVTRAALREMVVPALIPVAVPIVLSPAR